MWNAMACDCEYDKACRIGEYLDINNCTCKKCIFDKFVLTSEEKIVNTSGQ